MREWYWEVQQRGQGPDYFFVGRFDPSTVDRLGEVVHQNMPTTYVHNTRFSVSTRNRGCRSYTCYVDEHTYTRLASRRWWQGENIYYYGVIEVCDNELVFENVLGVSYGETPLLVAVARSTDVVWQGWTIGYSGYSSGDVATGTSAAELLEYLGC